MKAVNAVAFWSHQQVAVAFQQWKVHVQIAKELKSKAAIIVGRLTHSTQVSKHAARNHYLSNKS